MARFAEWWRRRSRKAKIGLIVGVVIVGLSESDPLDDSDDALAEH
jgi:hypothetical protein